jgi:hypothetical protein
VTQFPKLVGRFLGLAVTAILVIEILAPGTKTQLGRWMNELRSSTRRCDSSLLFALRLCRWFR